MKNKTQIFNTIKVIILAFILTAGIQYVSAQSWSAPTGSPPGNNTYAPLNVGVSDQYKSGGLGVGWGVTQANAIGFLVKNGAVGLGTSAPNTDSRLTVVGGNGDEIVRLDSRGQRASSYLKIWNDSGTNLFGVNAAGAWVGPDGNNPLGFKTNDTIRMKVMNSTGYVGIGPDLAAVDPSTNLDVNGQVRIRGGSPGSGKVLTSDNNGLATWQTPGVAATQVAPSSVVTGTSNSTFSTWTGINGAPGAHPDWHMWQTSCPSNKPTLVSCSGGVVRRTDDNTSYQIVPTIIIPDTTAGMCTMYSEYDGAYQPPQQSGGLSGAVRLYAVCI